MTEPYYRDEQVTLYLGDALAVLASLPDSSVDAVVTDPPYFRAINEPWDKAWRDSDVFIAWLKTVAEEWQRVLKPNGSLYVFASPQMCARVELGALEPAGFAILNRIVWHKMDAKIWRANRDGLTQYHSGDNERVLFAQPVKDFAAASSAERAYANAIHSLSAQVFAPIREYLESERVRRGLSNKEIDDALGCNGMARHWFGASQWELPSHERYEQLQRLFNAPNVDEYLRTEYEYLRTEYESLRTEYESLRRPFELGPEGADRPLGEVWRYPPPPPGRKGDLRHPCEKPAQLLEHMILTSTRPGDLILDSFAGSHSTGEAAVRLGRRFMGSEAHEPYCAMGVRRISTARDHEQPALDFGAST